VADVSRSPDSEDLPRNKGPSAHLRHCSQSVVPEDHGIRGSDGQLHLGKYLRYDPGQPIAREILQNQGCWVSVSKGGGKSGRIIGLANASTNSSARTVLDHDLTPQQEAEAQRLFEARQRPFLDEARRLARLLGSTKELLGTVFKTVLGMHGARIGNEEMPKLLKRTQAALGLDPADVDGSIPGAESLRKLLGSMAQIVVAVTELRNLYRL